MPGYKYIIWDWNGTILDDLQMNFEVENTLLSRRGRKLIKDIDEYHEKFQFPIIRFYESLDFDLENEKFEDIAREYVLEFDERFYELEVFPDAESIIREFKYKGIEQIILSQTEQRWLEKQVSYHDMAYLFTDLLGARDIYVKGKVGIALEWITKNNIDTAQVLMVGDTLHDFEVAETLGCDCILIARGHQPKEKLLTTGAVVLDTIEELIRMVI
ncbi:MAG: HAD family hydrolase [Clostridia bacterium]|nr:HAD family hydrolase [Clostridia bacterium]